MQFFGQDGRGRPTFWRLNIYDRNEEMLAKSRACRLAGVEIRVGHGTPATAAARCRLRPSRSWGVHRTQMPENKNKI